MNAEPDDLKVTDVITLKSQQMLAVNPEYQRGAVWTAPQKKKLIDSVLRPALDPDIIAAEIVEDLQAALAQFAEIASDLKRGASESKAEQA